MAYGEIAISDLSKLNSMFIRIARASHNRDQREQIRIDFLVANHCIEMLADIQRELESSFPHLTRGSWHKSSPGYWKEEDPDCDWHYLGFCWWKDNGLSINLALGFPQNKNVDRPSVIGYLWDDKREKLGDKKQCWQAISRFVHNGYVDKEKILKTAKGLLKNWAI